MIVLSVVGRIQLLVLMLFVGGSAVAQTAPSGREAADYEGLHAAAHAGDLHQLDTLLKGGAPIEARDSAGRTPLHIAAFASHEAIVRRLVEARADLNALEGQAYDAVTIAAVANDVPMLETLLELGASACNITSPYDGTALIAAAHLGHVEVVQQLIDADAPLDHVNNLGWTALIEAVVLGDGGPDHTATLAALVEAGADKDIGDRQGRVPLVMARERGFDAMVKLLEANQ